MNLRCKIYPKIEKLRNLPIRIKQKIKREDAVVNDDLNDLSDSNIFYFFINKKSKENHLFKILSISLLITIYYNININLF